MSWFKDFAEAIQALATVAGAIIAGWWAYYHFGLGQERYAHVETSADINFVGLHGNDWIVELIAYVENKGRAQHKMLDLNFELSSINKSDELRDSEEFGGQVLFPNLLKSGSFIGDYAYFVVDVGVKAKYSFVTRVPSDAAFLILHCNFKYDDERNFFHASETTVKTPDVHSHTS